MFEVEVASMCDGKKKKKGNKGCICSLLSLCHLVFMRDVATVATIAVRQCFGEVEVMTIAWEFNVCVMTDASGITLLST